MEFLLQAFATEGERVKRVTFGYPECCAAPPLASPLPACMFAPCPPPLSALVLFIDDEHVGKGILVYSHISSKRKTGPHVLFVPKLSTITVQPKPEFGIREGNENAGLGRHRTSWYRNPLPSSPLPFPHFFLIRCQCQCEGYET